MSENTTSMLPVKVGGTVANIPVRVEGPLLLASLGKAGKAASDTRTMFDALSEAVSRMNRNTTFFTGLNGKLQTFSGKMSEVLEPGVALDSAMARIAATSGETGEGLEEIERYARESAKTFGGSAADSADVYRRLLEELSPQIAKIPDALARMGANVQVTSKIMGKDTKGAMDLLISTMSQFGVALDDPREAAGTMSEMMNIMAAAARNGSAPLPVIQAALQESGKAAKSAGLSFAETNAAIQLLDRSGRQGSEGGIALRSVLTSLSESRFLPVDVQEQLQNAGVDMSRLTDQTLSLSQRLQPLQLVMHDNVLMTKMFGEEQANSASALLSQLSEMDQFTISVQGTNTAVDQAGVMMESYSESLLRQKSRIDDLKIGLFHFTDSVLPYVKGTIGIFQDLTHVMVGVNALATAAEMVWSKAIFIRNQALTGGIKAVLKSTGILAVYNVMMTAAIGITKAFSWAIRGIGKAIYSIPIIGWILAGISLLISVFETLWDNCEGFRQVLFGVWQAMKAVFYNIGVVLQSVYENLIKPIFVGLWEVVKSVTQAIAEGFMWCWNGIVSGATAVGDFFVMLWEGVMSAFSVVGDFFSGIWEGLSDSCSSVVAYISDAFSSIVEPVKEVFAGFWDTVKGIFDKITGYVQKFFGWIGKLWNKLFPKDQFKDIGEEYRSGMEAGSESFRKSQEAKDKEMRKPAGVPDISEREVPESFKQQENKKEGKEYRKMPKETALDLKGGTDYGAIIAGTSAVKANVIQTTVLSESRVTARAWTPSPQLKSGVQEDGDSKTDYLQDIASGVRKIAAGMLLLVGMTNVSSRAETIPGFSMQTALQGGTVGSVVPMLVPSLTSENPGELLKQEALGLPGSSDRQIQFGKFCDQVVIQVPAGTDRESVDYIYRELMKKINGGTNEF